MGKPVLTRGFYETLASEIAKLLDEERRATNGALDRLESRLEKQMAAEVRVLRAEISAIKKGRP